MSNIEWIAGPQIPVIDREGRVCISKEQADKHIFWETAALFVQVPFMAFLAFQPTLAPVLRVGAAAIAVTTVAVDGSLLGRYRKMKV